MQTINNNNNKVAFDYNLNYKIKCPGIYTNKINNCTNKQIGKLTKFSFRSTVYNL